MTEILGRPIDQDELALLNVEATTPASGEGEHIQWPTPAELCRPLDAQDFGWMRVVGAEIPEDEAAQQAWLEVVNGFMIAGSEKQGKRLDENYTRIVYDARYCFNNTFPAIKDTNDRLLDYTLTAGNYVSRASIPLVPSGNIVRLLRLYYSFLGWDIEHLLSSCPSLLQAPSEHITDRIDNILQKGMPIHDIQKIVVILSNSVDTIDERHRTLRSVARAWGVDDHPVICHNSKILGLSSPRIRTMGRLLTTLLPSPQSEISEVYAQDVLFMRPEAAIAAYLRRGAVISSFVGLRRQSKQLNGYSTHQLRGYIHTEHTRSPNDPVTKAYFKNYPLREGEAENLPELYELPALSKGQKSEWSDSPINGLEAHATRALPINLAHFKHTIANVEKSSDDIQCTLFARVTQCLRNEQNQNDDHPDRKEDVRLGREARKQLVMMYAQDVLSHMPNRYVDSEDRVQDMLLGLLIAINEFAQDNNDPKPETFTPFFEDFIKSKTFRELLAADEDL